ncbi:helix-turn-helix domain-containing protein [Dialister invisus]|uniref:helix-turn-helix domain-containing protein n=1 Tax=Dialister invisus TaxID=218538 RepID=UPI0023F95F95|nr:helix-turn-helix domain-containing protein [Dialister invisus]
MLPEMFTCEEVANRYRVKVLTVWEWIRKGKMSAIKLGRDYRISEEDLKKFEMERKTAANT